MKERILVLGAGFGGLELSTLLSDSLGDSVHVTLIDKSDHFMFGFSKLDVMFGHAEAHATRMPYTNFAKPGVRLVQQTVVKIDPAAKRVTTDTETHAADHLVVALGADYDWEATPGLNRRARILYRGRSRKITRRACQFYARPRAGRRLRRAI